MQGMRGSCLLAVALVASATRQPLRRSVLMIAVDDLRPQLSVYPEAGEYMHTPNFQRLANRTVTFRRAYVQVALCMPSRTSILVSRRPDTSRSWTIEPDQYWRLSGGNFTTLPQHFKQSGYLTIGMGKIFHEANSGDQDVQYSWSPEAIFSHGGQGIFDPPGMEEQLGASGLAYRLDDELEPQLQDGNLTDHAVKTIQGLASGVFGKNVATGERPFFLAVGLHKPHVPWYAPRRFWNHYPIAAVPSVPHPGLPTNSQSVSLQNWQIKSWCTGDKDMMPLCGTLSKSFPLDNSTVSAHAAAYMRQAYFASVSWTDANIGRILDAFEATPFNNDSVVVLWGDHGWHLGDNDQWAKMTNFEHATKIPLMIGCGGSLCSGHSTSIVEAIDIMPTILQEAGLQIPKCPLNAHISRRTSLCTEGVSLSNLLRNPGASKSTQSLAAAYSQFPRPEHPNSKPDLWCVKRGLSLENCPNKMGYTVRTKEYRYTAWVGFNKCSNSSCPDMLADWDILYGEELYNHTCSSPVCSESFDTETNNIAGLETSVDVKRMLFAQLKQFNTQKC